MAKTISLTDETYWLLQRTKQELSEQMNRRVTYDEVIMRWHSEAVKSERP